MRLIDADKIDFVYLPIAPVIKAADVHYETVAFKEDIDQLPTVEAIPVEFIKDLYKQAIEYRDRQRWMSSAWNRANEHAIGIDSILQVWDDRHG